MADGTGRLAGRVAVVTGASRGAGRGIAVRCDHAEPADVRALFERVEREQGRLDVLVNNAWGGHETFTAAWFDAPFWSQPLAHWDSMFHGGVRNAVVASQAAAPLLLRRRGGLVVTTSFWDRGRYLRGNLFYDLAKAALNRLAFACSGGRGRCSASAISRGSTASRTWTGGWCRRSGCLDRGRQMKRPRVRTGHAGP